MAIGSKARDANGGEMMHVHNWRNGFLVIVYGSLLYRKIKSYSYYICLAAGNAFIEDRCDIDFIEWTTNTRYYIKRIRREICETTNYRCIERKHKRWSTINCKEWDHNIWMDLLIGLPIVHYSSNRHFWLLKFYFFHFF